MELVFVALPVALIVGGAALVAFIWAARSDQFEDLDSPPERVLFDDPAVGGGSGRPGETRETSEVRVDADELERVS